MMLERERGGEDGKGRGGGGRQLLAVCNSAVKCLLPQQKSYHGRQCQLSGGGGPFAGSIPACNSRASLFVSVLQMLMSFLLPNAALSAKAVSEPCSPSLIPATTHTCESPEG